MRKCCAIADFLIEDNKDKMREAAQRLGFSIEFFADNSEAEGYVQDCEVLYMSGDTSLLSRELKALKWCHTAFAGVGKYIETGIFDSGDIRLTNSSGAYGRTISEYIIMVTLMLMKRMPDYLELIERREWVQDLPVRSVAGSTIAILGTGDIGTETALKYRALGTGKLIGFNRSGKSSDAFDEVYNLDEFDAVLKSDGLADSLDVLVLCLPGTSETKGLLSRERIALLSEKTYVVNIGRGSVVDQDALTDALNGERIAGAALDVMYPEPLPADHPLWSARNCIVTPHMSGDMGLQHTVDITVDLFCENLKRYTAGEELNNLIDPNKGY